MTVLVTAEVQGQTRQGYEGMFSALSDGLKQAPGFVLHAAHPIEGAGESLKCGNRKRRRISSSRSKSPLTCRLEFTPSVQSRSFTAC